MRRPYQESVNHSGVSAYTASQQIRMIQNVKRIWSHLKVGTDDTWDSFAYGSADAIIEANPDMM
jgi:hypothetical protein